MKLALVQMNSNHDRDDNIARACQYIREAAEQGADLVVLPEFFNMPYRFHAQDITIYDAAERIDGPSISAVRAVATELKVNLIATIYEFERSGLYYDTAFVFDRNGDLTGKYRKTHPAGPLIDSLERLYYKAGTEFSVFDVDDWKVGVSICYDWRFPETVRCLALNGAELVVMPFASPHTAIWPKAMPTRAWENNIYVAPCNHVGKEIAVDFDGQSMVCSPKGEILACIGDREGVLLVELDRNLVIEAHWENGTFRDRRPEIYRPITSFEDRSL